MQDIIEEIRKVLRGEVASDTKHRNAYMHDASIYELIPDAVVYPNGTSDIKKLVNLVHSRKSTYPKLSITARAAGTDMSGGPLSDSIIVDMTRYFKAVSGTTNSLVHSEPGVFLPVIDALLEKQNSMLGCAPASRAYSTIGGLVANNGGGEQSFRYGNADKTIREIKAVLADGNEYTFKPITKKQLDLKMKQKNFEGEIYRRMFKLVDTNYDLIKNAHPHVSKHSMGYNLWYVWDRETGIFDLSRLFTGSQGTLGIITDLKIQAVPKAKHKGLLIAYVRQLSSLGEIIPTVVSHNPSTFEGFDNITFKLGIRYFDIFRRQLGMKEWLKQQASLLGSVVKLKGHIPDVVLMIEFEGETYEEVMDKILAMQSDLRKHKLRMRTEIEGTEELSKPFWAIRRASLSLIRNKVKHKYASSFMDDLTIPPKHIPEFFPQVRKIIRKYKLPATLSGHFGDGNFHIIPLMDIANIKDQLKLEPAMRELVPIVLKYGGSLSGEHNDGMIRGPWLRAMFGEKVYELFKDTKEIFDPMYIFNPHKKTDASWDFSMSNIRKKN